MNAVDVIVVGAGPAGLLAACRAAERGFDTVLLEKNPRPGAKILISGGGHCNLTHATDAKGIVGAFGPAGRFLHSALAALDPQGLVDLVAAEGVASRTEPDGKVLPASDRAADVLAALVRRLRHSGATLAVGEPVLDIRRDDSGFHLVTSRRTLSAAKVVLSTGGRSYPACGTTGDGYRWAAALGHAVVPPRPALVPIVTGEDWVKQLQGITVEDVLVRVVPAEGEAASGRAGVASREPPVQRRGSLLFAHFGLSGPVALDLSRAVSACPRGKRPSLACDFLPDVTPSELDSLLVSRSARSGRRQAASLLESRLPRRLAEALTARSQVDPAGRAAELSRAERLRLVEAVKRLCIRTTGTLGFEKAEVTAGGVSLSDVDSRTMQSRRVAGLYLAGELLDLDGPIGGYNLQAAFSTGYLAGERL